MESKKFVFKQRSVDDVKKRSSGNKSDRVLKEGYKEFKSQEGENHLRVMPNTWDKTPKHYGTDIFVHYQVGPDKAQYLCLERMKLGSGKCSVCDEGYKPARQEWEAEPESNKERKDELKKYMVSLSPKKSVAMWVIDRKHEDVGPQIYLMTDAMDREFAARGVDAFDASLISIEDPYEGYDISFTRTGKGLITKYIGHDVARRKTPLSTEHGEKWLEFIVNHPLPQCFVVFSSEYIDAVYHAKLPNKVDADAVDGTTEAEKSDPAGSSDQQESADTAVEEFHEGTSAETTQEEVLLTYEDLASLSKDELVNFAKENVYLNAVEIKLAGSNILNKLCAKMGINVPGTDSKPAEVSAQTPPADGTARNNYKERLKQTVADATAKGDA